LLFGEALLLLSLRGVVGTGLPPGKEDGRRGGAFLGGGAGREGEEDIFCD
jgi:hypothetical protein